MSRRDIDPNICPACESEEIEAYDTDSTDTHHYEKMSCAECNATWSLVYKLTGMEDLRAGDLDDGDVDL